jgi:hypothetical protein
MALVGRQFIAGCRSLPLAMEHTAHCTIAHLTGTGRLLPVDCLQFDCWLSFVALAMKD